jgi:hypothetical protein
VMYAKLKDGTITKPFRGARAQGSSCPQCGEPVMTRCGELNVWHFAHYSDSDCEAWSEPECEWHRSWKELVPADQCEVTVGEHRADLITNRGFIVELQHSTLSVEEAQEREFYYGDKMVWLIDGTIPHPEYGETLIEPRIRERCRYAILEPVDEADEDSPFIWRCRCAEIGRACDMIVVTNKPRFSIRSKQEWVNRSEGADILNEYILDGWFMQDNEGLPIHYKWLWPKRWLSKMDRQVYIDLGPCVVAFYKSPKNSGFGEVYSAERFRNWITK